MKIFAFLILALAPFSQVVMACQNNIHTSHRVTLADFPFAGQNGFSNPASFPYSFNELQELYDQSYQADKRLTHHAYLAESGQWQIPFRNQVLELSESFIGHLSFALDQFLEQKKIRFLFFPDAGHAHLLLPITSMHFGKNNLTPEDFQDVLSSQNFAILLHTREQADFFDPETLHPQELQERNLLINFANRTHQVLSLEDYEFGEMYGINRLDGYQYTSFSFYFHAHQRGCLALEKSNLNFDLSLRFH